MATSFWPTARMSRWCSAGRAPGPQRWWPPSPCGGSALTEESQLNRSGRVVQVCSLSDGGGRRGRVSRAVWRRVRVLLYRYTHERFCYKNLYSICFIHMYIYIFLLYIYIYIAIRICIMCGFILCADLRSDRCCRYVQDIATRAWAQTRHLLPAPISPRLTPVGPLMGHFFGNLKRKAPPSLFFLCITGQKGAWQSWHVLLARIMLKFSTVYSQVDPFRGWKDPNQ